jgi:FkbM family methyltransferase
MLIKQQYNPTIKISKINFFFRVLSLLIIKIFFIDKIKKFSNSFQQLLITKIKIIYKNKIFFFRDGHERLFWRYTTQFIEEKKLCDWIDTFQKKDIFLDIGSNVGMFSIYAASKDILTYAVEPHPSNLEYLYWNIYLNNLNKKVLVFPNALGNQEKVGKFSCRDLTPGVAQNQILSVKQHSKINFLCPIISFDKIIEIYKLKKPNKVKIDVDGVEFQILKGMSKTLNRVDEIYIEMLSEKKKNKSYYKILKLLKKYDFHIKNKHSENYIFKKKH